MKYLILGIGFLFSVISQADMSCRFVPAGCSMNTRCYYGRLQLGCDGVNGYISDKVIPSEINIYRYFNGPNGKMLSKPMALPNTEGLTLADIVEPSAKGAAWAKKNNVDFNIEEMSVYIDSGTTIYTSAAGAATRSARAQQQSSGRYTCEWNSYPSKISSQCTQSKAFCKGRAICQESGVSGSFDADVDCLSSVAGQDCANASACANSNDSKEIAEIKQCAGAPVVQSGGKTGSDGLVPKGVR
jgi:hypothetical protein